MADKSPQSPLATNWRNAALGVQMSIAAKTGRTDDVRRLSQQIQAGFSQSSSGDKLKAIQDAYAAAEKEIDASEENGFKNFNEEHAGRVRSREEKAAACLFPAIPRILYRRDTTVQLRLTEATLDINLRAVSSSRLWQASIFGSRQDAALPATTAPSRHVSLGHLLRLLMGLK